MYSIRGVKYWASKLLQLILLVLFIGYYGSITFFPHSHNVNGVTIVHSHPYKSEKGSDPLRLPHTDKEIMLIQALSLFITGSFVIWFLVLILKSVLQKSIIPLSFDGYAEPGGYINYALRAPPIDMIPVKYSSK